MGCGDRSEYCRAWRRGRRARRRHGLHSRGSRGQTAWVAARVSRRGARAPDRRRCGRDRGPRDRRGRASRGARADAGRARARRWCGACTKGHAPEVRRPQKRWRRSRPRRGLSWIVRSMRVSVHGRASTQAPRRRRAGERAGAGRAAPREGGRREDPGGSPTLAQQTSGQSHITAERLEGVAEDGRLPGGGTFDLAFVRALFALQKPGELSAVSE